MHLTRSRLSSVLVLVILFSSIIVSGCTRNEEQSPAVPAGNDSWTAAGNLPHRGGALLLKEAERELARLNTSEYMHTTAVDEQNGTYNYDCSGFVAYALERADPGAYHAFLNIQAEKDQPDGERPEAEDFYSRFVRLGTVPGTGGWMGIASVPELRPGDIIVWLKPDSSDSKSTGHVMIVAGIPAENPARNGEMLIRVIDSTTSMHSRDSRIAGQTGLGEGIIGIMTDPAGYPTGFYWRGGESQTLQKTEIAFARIA